MHHHLCLLEQTLVSETQGTPLALLAFLQTFSEKLSELLRGAARPSAPGTSSLVSHAH